MKELLIIADDLTGACDAASCITRLGKKVSVVIDSDTGSSPLGSESTFVFNTQSRLLDKESAHLKVSGAISNIISKVDYCSNGFTIIKKIDTAFRGNIGMEIEAMMAGFGKSSAFIVNVIPSMNRVTYDGYQYIDGLKISETDFANDPMNPVKESFIQAILAETTKADVELISLKDIRNGCLDERIGNSSEAGKRIYVFDAVTKEDVCSIVDQLLECRSDHIWVGSLGLIDVITEKLHPAVNKDNKAAVNCELKQNGIILGVSGSANVILKEQLDAAKDAQILEIIGLKMDSHYNFTPADVCSGKVIDNFLFVIPEDIKSLEAKIGKKETNNKIIDQLAAAIEDILEIKPVKCIVLVGGETSYGIFKHLGAQFLNISRSIDTAIVEGYATGGRIDQKRVIIKGGSIGNSHTIKNLYNYIEKGIYQ